MICAVWRRVKEPAPFLKYKTSHLLLQRARATLLREGLRPPREDLLEDDSFGTVAATQVATGMVLHSCRSKGRC